MAELTLWWSPDDERGGVLDARVTTGEFSGHGHAFFSRRELEERFLAGLRTYPLSPSHPVKIESGYWIAFSPDGNGPVELGITIKPYNSRGALLVRVDLSTPMRAGADEDLQNAITVRFVTDYEALDKFSADLQALLEGDGEEAILRNAGFS